MDEDFKTLQLNIKTQIGEYGRNLSEYDKECMLFELLSQIHVKYLND